MDGQKKKTEAQGGRYAYDGLDRVLRRWTPATVALVLVAIVIGWTLLPR